MRSLFTTSGMALLVAAAFVIAGQPDASARPDGPLLAAAQKQGHGGHHGGGGGMGMGRQAGMSSAEHQAIFTLLSQHDAIVRKVADIPGGVKTTTTTTTPELVDTLRLHVRQMARRLDQGRPVRIWDPVFRGVFAYHEQIKMTFRDIEGGIEVVETSPNPTVVGLIRAHADKVSSFAENGHAAARPPWAGGRGPMRRGR